MKSDQMICEYCGRSFISEYWEGGYIDHYENFAAHHMCYGKDVEHDIKEICFHNNDLRDDDDIKERLNCYLKWDNVPDDIKIEVKEKVENAVQKIRKTKQNVENTISNCTKLEFELLAKRVKGAYHSGSIYNELFETK